MITNVNYKPPVPMINLVSPCCHAGIGRAIVRDYPLGGNTWYQSYRINVCEKCGEEVHVPVEQCGICGEVGCRNECEGGMNQ